jgi:hypothetical protein
MPEEEVDIYTEDFNLKSIRQQCYQGVFDAKRQRLKFRKINLIFLYRENELT